MVKASASPLSGIWSKLRMLFVSYRNHVIYLSFYAWMVSNSFQRLQDHPYHSSLKKDVSLSAELSGLSFWGWLLVHYGVLVFFSISLLFEVRFVWKRRNMPPGDSGWPLVGHFFHSVADSHEFHRQRVLQFGSLSTYRMIGNLGLLLTDDDDIRWATTQERKGTTRPLVLPHFFELIGDESIFLSTGEAHKRLRRIFEPAFTPSAIKDYSQSIDKVVRAQLEEWSDSNEYQPPREWALLSMKVFFVCAFGEADLERLDKLAGLFEGWIDGFRALPVKIPGGDLVRAHRCKHQIFDMFREMIAEFKSKNPPPEKGEANEYKSVLGRLCYAVDENGKTPTEKVLLDNLLFFLFAGFDTTKASFGGIFHFLKKSPHALEALLEEVNGLELDETDPDVDLLKRNAPVLNAVLAENWRLAAPLPSHINCASVDLYYKGYTIPKDTFLLFDIHAHNTLNEERYKGASDFRFERWLTKDHPLYNAEYANRESIDYNVMSNKFRSFNMGQHMCLGGHFAKMTVRIVVTRILRSYTMEIRNEKLMKFPFFQISNEFKLTKKEKRDM